MTATAQQIAEQAQHLANVAAAHADLIAGHRDWRTLAATPDLAEKLAWKKVTEAMDLLNAWTGVTTTEDPATNRRGERFTVRKQSSGRTCSVSYFVYDRQGQGRVTQGPLSRQQAAAKATDLNHCLGWVRSA